MANKKILVVSLIGTKHIITESDLAANPDLVDKVKVGDEVELGPDQSAVDRIAELEQDVHNRSNIIIELNDKINSLTSELTEERKKSEESNLSFADLKKQFDSAKEQIKSLSLENLPPVVDAAKVRVNHGVVLNGKTYSKEQIQNDASIQEVLLDLKSSAVSAIKV